MNRSIPVSYTHLAMEAGLIETDHIIADCKSGTTGAGRKPTQTTHFPDCNESFTAYKVAAHRHTPEIEQTLSCYAPNPVKLTFVPHLLPVSRGILATCYATLREGVTEEQVRYVYGRRYQQEYFVLSLIHIYAHRYGRVGPQTSAPFGTGI